MMVGFDIETKPRLDLKKICPPFRKDAVKLGRLKDPEKIKAKLEEAEQNHFENFASDACLCPWKGEVLVVGVFDQSLDKFECLHGANESGILIQFWELYRSCERTGKRMVGHNIFDFDLPFLVNRSWANRVTVPSSVAQFGQRYPNWNKNVFIDTLLAFKMGRRDQTSSFQRVGDTIGTGGKTNPHVGERFHEFWKENRDTALRYLANDCRLPVEWCEIMGLADPWRE